MKLAAIPNGRALPELTDTLPPHSERAERGVLGALLLAHESGEDAGKLLEELKAGDFFLLAHKTILRALKRLAEGGAPLSVGGLLQHLTDKRLLEDAGGTAAVAELPNAAASHLAFTEHLAVLRDKAQRRLLIEGGERLAKLARDESLEPASLAEGAEALLEPAVRSASPKKQFLQFWSPRSLAEYQPPADAVLVGERHIMRGAIAVIAGAPGVGKSRAATALAIAGARGAGDWFGLRVHRAFRTLIVQAENGLHRLREEFGTLTQFEHSIRVTSPPERGMRFDNPDFRAELVRFVEEFRPSVIIVDPWNAVSRDDKQGDYSEAFANLRAVQPCGPDAPALVIVAHTRKPGTERKSGRSLLHELAGSHVLGSVPRAAFVMEAATDSPEDERVVWTCAKSNDGPLPPRSAWFRRANGFTPCPEFDWKTFDAPASSGPGRKTVELADLEEIFDGGRRSMTRTAARDALEELTKVCRSSCYDALSLTGRFGEHLFMLPGGLLTYKP